MIDYNRKTDPSYDDGQDTVAAITGVLENPFPGLRPFDINECHLFFGRESHSDEILLKLSQNRFVSVLGYSGSGKSSLMYCGVIPVLYGGFMTEAGPDWTVITTRPGSDPFGNLANAILQNNNRTLDSSSTEFQHRKKVVESVLRSDGDGLLTAIQYFRRQKRQNYLIVIDQFEELFRLRKEIPTEDVANMTAQYVELLLRSLKSSDNSVYIALTLRSDFIGDCSVFRGLTKLINRSNYLVPRMSPDQKKIAIEGPIAVGGGRISQRLMSRLIEEVGDNQDQLPILQHALMRTWDYWVENRDQDEAIDLRHYNAIGKMSGALSQHADEIYEELTPRQKHIAETLFKLLTQKGQDNQGLRRPARLGNAAQLAGVSNEEVMEVVNAFRRPGRSFLMPAHFVPLTADTLVEISHESLMRIWVRLKNWVEEEHESAQMYLRLSDAAEMYQVGRTGLWRPPDLQLALNWQKKQKPNKLWAQRYHEAFERSIVFLDTSRITYEAEQKNQEMQQKRLLRRARLAAIFLGIAFIIAIVFFVFGVIQQLKAESEAEIAKQNAIIATEQSEQARIAQQQADSARSVAVNERIKAEEAAKALQESYVKLSEANRNLQNAIRSEKAALNQATIERDIAKRQTLLAEQKSLQADSASVVANKNFEQAQRLLYLSVAQSMSSKSVTIEDNNLKGLLAFQAFIFNKAYDGRKLDPYIYNGLHSTLTQLEGKTYNTRSVHRNSVRSVAFPNSSDIFFSTGADGNVVRNVFSTGKSEVLSSSKYRNKIIEVNAAATYMISGGDSSFVNIFELANINKSPRQVKIHETFINDIQFLPDNRFFITAGGDKTIKKTDVLSGTVENLLTAPTEIKTIKVSKDGNWLAMGGLNGRVSLLNLSDRKETILVESRKSPIFSISFSPDSKYLALGDESGHVELWTMKDKKKFRDLTSHKARVSDIEFSDNGEMMASASLDGSINIWVMSELNELPIALTDNDSYVWDVDFSPDSGFLLAACDNGEIRVWTTSSEELAEGMCERLQRNMTLEEWEQYVGNELPFMNTCVDKIIER